MHKDLISLEIFVNFRLCSGPLNMISPEVLVIYGAIEGKCNHLIFSIYFWGPDHRCIEEVMGGIRPGYIEIRLLSQHFIVISKDSVEKLAISVFVGSQELDDDAVEHLNHVVEDLTVRLDMKILEIDGTSTNHLPDGIVVLVFLDPELQPHVEPLHLDVREVEHLEFSNLEATGEMAFQVCPLDFHYNARLLLARDYDHAPLLDV